VLQWLRDNVHRHGYLYEAGELMTKTVGEPVTARPLLSYLGKKYSEL
jgi:carboxypeptidase Taq